MSCDVTKLDYLKETKQLIRNKIDPKGEKITDETPFRNYAAMIGGTTAGTAAVYAQGAVSNIAGKAEIITEEDQ